MISDEELSIISESRDLYMGANIGDMAKELLALRKIQAMLQAIPVELPCNVTVGETTFREGVKTINLLKAIHRRSLKP